MRRTSRTGFTIVELLVVVSIIAMLLGMLLPAVSEARDQARINISHSNLHNLGVAHVAYAANASLNLPISFGSIIQYFGALRLGNVRQFNQYVSHKFYDKVFFAPKDTIVLETITTSGYDGANMFEDPGEHVDRPHVDGLGEAVIWPSYCLSPAGMYNPAVMAHDDPDDGTFNGWGDPWSLSGGFRSPALSQALYPSGVRDMMHADARIRTQTGNANWGLWSRDTAFGAGGYLSEYGYDFAATSFHILTTDGIRGRDKLTDLSSRTEQETPS